MESQLQNPPLTGLGLSSYQDYLWPSVRFGVRLFVYVHNMHTSNKHVNVIVQSQNNTKHHWPCMSMVPTTVLLDVISLCHIVNSVSYYYVILCPCPCTKTQMSISLHSDTFGTFWRSKASWRRTARCSVRTRVANSCLIPVVQVRACQGRISGDQKMAKVRPGHFRQSIGKDRNIWETWWQGTKFNIIRLT